MFQINTEFLLLLQGAIGPRWVRIPAGCRELAPRDGARAAWLAAVPARPDSLVCGSCRAPWASELAGAPGACPIAQTRDCRGAGWRRPCFPPLALGPMGWEPPAWSYCQAQRLLPFPAPPLLTRAREAGTEMGPILCGTKQAWRGEGRSHAQGHPAGERPS